MGKLLPNLTFTGSVSNFSAYTMRGHDKVIIRSKGGASREQIQTAPSFRDTRNLNNEWKGVTTAAQKIRNGLYGLKPLADYNISGPLNALVKKIQSLDTINPKGKRSILFSLQPDFIGSFSYNRQTLFDTVIRQPLTIDIDKTAGLAELRIPALQQQVNFFSHPRYDHYRFVLAATHVSNVVWNEATRNYITLNDLMPQYKPVYTPWAHSNLPQPSADYLIGPAFPFSPGPDMILVFGAGIQYGLPAADGSIQPAPYVGAARIIKSV
ncbi:MAG TPA: hypothetical protein VK543_13270 [Puia sp.]|nr:hypothetical protein [Puia sp.]